jgi:hypothetical protein
MPKNRQPPRETSAHAVFLPRTATLVAVAATLVAVIGGVFWIGSGAGRIERPAPDLPPSHSAPRSISNPLVVPSAGAPPAPPAEPSQADRAESDAAADAAQIAAVKAALMENLEAGYHSRFVARLAAQGLAEPDAERIVAGALQEYASCSVDAFVSAAVQQSVPLHTLLDALEAMLVHADGPDVSAVIDMRSIAEPMQACALGASQSAGLTLP